MVRRNKDGTWPLLSTNWPSFLYAAEATYDSEDPNIGLFHRHAGIRAFQHLYLGPAAAGSQEHNDDNGKHGRSKSKATVYGLTKVTPQVWAWAMCAVWFSLSACNSYKMCIGSFNLEKFFFAIIKTLNDPKDPWAVFGKHAVKAMTTTSDHTDSDLAKMFPSQATPSTSSPPWALTPLSDLESFPPSPAKQPPMDIPPTIPTAILPRPVPAAHKNAKPVPRPKPIPKAKLVPKAQSKTCGSAHLSGGDIQVEEPTNEVGGADIPDAEAPAPPKKKPAPCHGKKAA
ncbi:uncharacterized protein BJ212DRAFT_1483474 [Suillus subaureus]|uniref:Uncharacterized protein n=1 Tax=Suillus subaureus TaxID=48587 RepID=A0A9P7E5B7_9AGAM|nr:uncharacterized protein BJ212DRAFT_1483474 [Suillus subaureus]KAG1811737.1 hypothetical protein BJ212DRAFT_1483474 [Suillus subaureus]